MRVGILTYGLDRQRTGIGTATVGLIEAIRGLGRDDLQIIPLTPYRRGLFASKEHGSYFLRGCRLMPATMTLGSLLILVAARRLGLDVVHDPTAVSPFAIRQGWGRCRKVLTIHDLFARLAPKTQPVLLRFAYSWWIPATLGNVDAVIVPSCATKRDMVDLVAADPQKIAVIHPGVSRQFKPVADREQDQAAVRRYGVRPPYVLFMGGVEPRKNLATLLKAYAMARPRLREWSLVVVGKKRPISPQISRLLDSLGLQKHTVFVGYVEDKDLPSLYRMAELFVFPTLYEGFGFPPLEAMACGTPVITSNTSSLPEVVGDAALCVSPHDAKAIADAMDAVLTSSAVRDELVQKGLARSALFTWERSARDTVALYEQLLSEG